MQRIDNWIRLVEQHTGVEKASAIRPERVSAVVRALEKFDRQPADSDEAIARAVVALARSLHRLKPIRERLGPIPMGRRQAGVAAATAIAELRNLGWAPQCGLERKLADMLRANAPPIRLRTAVLAHGGPPVRSDELNAVVYLSVPVASRTPAMYRKLALWASEIEEELELLGAQHGLNLFLHVLGLGQRDESQLRSSARLGLRDSVLHLVLGANGGTSGVGRELQASIARRRPVAWFVPPGETHHARSGPQSRRPTS